uniref:RRM domain-containing protein n=1 Tax=Alexandrium monilatum TaxID=311494 RepID=A0A7S4QMZ8_9DINO
MARSTEGVAAYGPAAAGPLAAGPLAVGLVPSSVFSSPSTTSMPTSKGAVAGGAETSGEQISDTVYFGTVKSYNDRRGFGFIACAETLATYGRDVYMAKAEVQNAGDMGNTGSRDVGHRGKYIADFHSALRIAEEDSVRFQVRLSVEGYPQAANVQRLRKFRGMVLHPPPEEGSSTNEDGDEAGTIVSEELMRVFGDREACLKRVDCGQVRLSSGDEVSFCMPEGPLGQGQGAALEAKQVVLLKTNRFTRTILGCFSLRLPRPRMGHNRAHRKDLRVDCHAFNDRIIIAGLPGDCDESELRRFFSKQGASDTIATRARGCGFASVSFPSMAEVAKFLSRTAHAFTDDKETQIATLHGRRTCTRPHADTPRLPALPAPSLLPGEINGTLLVNWSPLVLAVGYSVELRPVGMCANWQGVDGATGSLTTSASRFDKDRSSCKVMGLDATRAYEARVTYFTSCGCRAEASDISERCIPCPGARMPSAHPGFPLGLAGAGGLALPAVFGSCWPGAAAAAALTPMQLQAALQPTWPMGLPTPNSTGLVAGLPPATQPPLSALVSPPATSLLASSDTAQVSLSAGGTATAGSGWRCAHGAVIPPPPVPEVHPADEYGFAISVQWPSVSHATAYVVELREQGSSSVERFMRSAPMATRGSIVELRVGGLRPSGPPGQRYAAQVRCIADCGCESAPSAPGWSPTLGASAQPTAPATQVAQGSPTMLPTVAPSLQDALAPSPLGGASLVTPTLLPPTMTEQPQQQQQQTAPPQAFMTAVGMPSWVSAMQSQKAMQPTAVALYSQAPDSSPVAIDAGSAPSAAATLAAAMASADMGVAMGAPLVPPPMAPPSAKLLQVSTPHADSADTTPPELTGCEECLLLD